MDIDKKAFDCINMLYHETASEQIKKDLNLSNAEYEAILSKWGIDDVSQPELAKHSIGIGKKFMELTRYPFLSESDQVKGVPCPLAFKKFEGPTYSLLTPSEFEIPNTSLYQTMEQRRSVRNYKEKALTLDELSYLVWSTQGVRLYKQTEKACFTMRTVPSAGARHAFETYLLINNVEDIPSGLYFYNAEDNQIIQLTIQSDIAEILSQACFEQPMIKSSAVTFIWAAIPYRMSWRYGERSWRYLHVDAGHVCQNLYLAGESIDCGVCAIGAYSDELFAIALNLDIDNEFVIYAATIGKKVD
jgi:SagB-type dehydrogenase family enzyme